MIGVAVMIGIFVFALANAGYLHSREQLSVGLSELILLLTKSGKRQKLNASMVQCFAFFAQVKNQPALKIVFPHEPRAYRAASLTPHRRTRAYRTTTKNRGMHAMKERPNDWSDSDTCVLLDEWSTRSASQIGAELHRSRSAVCAKAKRLRGEGKLAANVDKRLVARTSRRRADTAKRVRTVTPPKPPTIKPPRVEHYGSASPVTFAELEPWHCHWPLGDPRAPDFRYCGALKLDGLPYCKHHCDIAYPRKQGEF
jgi:GcrA cell cycle regulator